MSNENTGAEVSSTPYLDPERAKALALTEEPQARTGLGGHAVPDPGHLRVLSAQGVGEREGVKKSDWGKHQPDFEPTPPDAPPAEVVAGGGTVGPKGVESPNEGTGTDNASTVSETLNTKVEKVTEGAPKGTSSTPTTATEEPAPKKRATRKSTTKKSAGDRAGTTSKEK